VPVDGFFEWRVIKGQRAKLPYAIAMKDGAPFGLAGIWENWNPRVRRLRTIVTTDANELVADIHDRMPSFFARGLCAFARCAGSDAAFPGRLDADAGSLRKRHHVGEAATRKSLVKTVV
jgi:hypothetical protein